jgi:glucose/arabinose dehydrogenase
MNAMRAMKIGVLVLAAWCAPMAWAQPLPGDVPVNAVISAGLSGPVGIFNAGDGSNRLFIIQQGGAARVAVPGGTPGSYTLNATPYFTLSNANTQCAETVGGTLANTGFVVGSETGLLGLAFHPTFETNGQVFVSFSGANGDTIVSRYTVSNPTTSNALSAGDLATCVVVLRVDQDFSNHNGGNIVFGPDGFLYFGLGDGGSGGDPCNRGQTLNPANLDNSAPNCSSDTSFTDPDNNGIPDRPTITRALLGKMLRIDVNGATSAGGNGLCGARLDGAANYAIPPSNPFAGADPQTACDEVWAYGLRNPWRWSFDRQTNDLIIGDVGQDRWEEVNFQPASSLGGTNYGWDVCEGTHTQGSCTTACSLGTSQLPIIEYNNTGNGCGGNPTPAGCSVTGGYRYRGPSANLQAVYFYGDACNSELRYSVDTGGGTWVQPATGVNIVTGLAGTVVAFGESEVGELYMIGGSTMYRIGNVFDSGIIFINGFE